MDAEIPTEEQLGDMHDAAREYEEEQENDAMSTENDRVLLSVTSIVGASNTRARQYRKMTEAICEMLTDMGLVSFLPLNIQDGEVRNVFQRSCLN